MGFHAINVGRSGARRNGYSIQVHARFPNCLYKQLVAEPTGDDKIVIMAIELIRPPLQIGPQPLLPRWAFYGGVLVIVFLVLLVILPRNGGGIQRAPESAAMQTTRTIALAMFQYANDNNDRYPDGASSTEVFQKLMDGNYITDPSIFYVALPGKVRAVRGAKLKPENVAYDVTSGVDANSPDDVPIVFITGFRMDYHAGANAVSLVRPFPSTVASIPSWFSDHTEPSTTFNGLVVAYKNNDAYFRESYLAGHPTHYTTDGYGIVPNVIPAGFDAHGQTLRQLTPDGVLK